MSHKPPEHIGSTMPMETGVLLQLARIVWNDPQLHTTPLGRMGWTCHIPAYTMDLAGVCEADALYQAIKAAFEVKL